MTASILQLVSTVSECFWLDSCKMWIWMWIQRIFSFKWTEFNILAVVDVWFWDWLRNYFRSVALNTLGVVNFWFWDWLRNYCRSAAVLLTKHFEKISGWHQNKFCSVELTISWVNVKCEKQQIDWKNFMIWLAYIS